MTSYDAGCDSSIFFLVDRIILFIFFKRQKMYSIDKKNPSNLSRRVFLLGLDKTLLLLPDAQKHYQNALFCMKFNTLHNILYTYTIRYIFSSNHNIHKSSSGLCFWASDPLIERFL